MNYRKIQFTETYVRIPVRFKLAHIPFLFPGAFDIFYKEQGALDTHQGGAACVCMNNYMDGCICVCMCVYMCMHECIREKSNN